MAIAGEITPRAQPTALDQAIADCRSAIGLVAAFSFVINLLMLSQPIYMLQVYDRVLTTGHHETLLLLTGIVAASLLVLGALDAARSAVTARVAGWLADRLAPVYLESSVRGRLLGDQAGAQPLRDLTQIQQFIASPGLITFFDIPWVPVFVALVWMLHPWLGMLALASALVLLGLGLVNDFATRKLVLDANMAQIAATQRAEAAVRNAEVVRAMGMLPAMMQRWQTVHRSSLDTVQRANERSGLLLGITKSLRFGVQIAILGLGAWLVLGGELTGGGMVAASILLGRALAPVEQGMSTWRNFSLTRIGYNRLKSRLRALPAELERTRLPAPMGYLAVKDLTYLVAGTKEPVLRQITFALRPGEAVAVIGPSASGKSTLCRLLVGTATPHSGAIRLDGSELQHWDPDQLGRHIGYLPQDVELFPGTVRENIARMDEGDDDAVVQAAMLAHAHEMIQQLPNGYETQMGEGGTRLSGGQRQRIGLARAVYGEPKLIVLDEPNANLDQVGESALAAAVKELKSRGAALIIVGHRPSTIAEADKILLLKGGRVEIFGARDEVLQKLRNAANPPGGAPGQKPAVAERRDEPALASTMPAGSDAVRDKAAVRQIEAAPARTDGANL